MPSKDLLLSKTTWGTIVAMIAMVATALGYDIGDQGALVNAIIGVIGGGFAIYGRVVAVHKISSVAGVSIGGGQ
jgi:hypothetical protein